MRVLMQGDQYNLFVSMSGKNEKGEDCDLTVSDIRVVEVCIGPIRKCNPDVLWSPVKNGWDFHITQEESFGMPTGKNTVQVRALFPPGDVFSADTEVYVVESISKNIL